MRKVNFLGIGNEYEKQWSNGIFQVDEYTRLEEEETLIENGTVFFANQLNFLGSNYLGFGTVEIRNFTQLRQKILR